MRDFWCSTCPITVLEQKITWQEFINLLICGFFGMVLLASVHIALVMFAGIFGG